MAGSTRIWAGKTDEDKPEPSSPSTFMPLLLWGIGLIAVGISVVWSSTAAAVLKPQSQAAASPAFLFSDSPQRYAVGTSGEPSIGPKNALVTIVEFGDFQCPFCKRFFADVEQPLLKKYAGKIRFVYRDFPLPDMHANAEIAAEAAHCAEDQRKFWEYHDLLYQNQPLPDTVTLTTYATQLNLDMSAFGDCLSNRKHAKHIQANLAEGRMLGVRGTPTFFINGRKLEGAQPLSAFSIAIDVELAALSDK